MVDPGELSNKLGELEQKVKKHEFYMMIIVGLILIVVLLRI
jgi:hypothetical protein